MLQPAGSEGPASHIRGAGDWRARVALTGVVPIGGKSQFKPMITARSGIKQAQRP
jgi:hypothetical protein